MVVKEPVRAVARLDVLVFTSPPRAAVACGRGGVFVQRAIGLPGDSWAERDGLIFIDGKKLDEPFIRPTSRDTETFRAREIAPDEFLMMGDNRAGSCDSRAFGLVPRANLIGKVVKIERAGESWGENSCLYRQRMRPSPLPTLIDQKPRGSW